MFTGENAVQSKLLYRGYRFRQSVQPFTAGLNELQEAPSTATFWNKTPQTGFFGTPESKRNGVTVMKTLVSMVALILALAVTGPAFAGDVTKATDKASCDKAGGTWDDTAKKCSEKKM